MVFAVTLDFVDVSWFADVTLDVLHLTGCSAYWSRPFMVVAAIDSQVPKLDDRISLWQVLRKNEALANISEGLSAHGVSGSNKANPT